MNELDMKLEPDLFQSHGRTQIRNRELGPDMETRGFINQNRIGTRDQPTSLSRAGMELVWSWNRISINLQRLNQIRTNFLVNLQARIHVNVGAGFRSL